MPPVSDSMINVIIADDHEVYRSSLRRLLSLKTDLYFLHEACNGSELLECLTTVIPHVVLLDIQMPVMDGVATLPRIRECYPDIKVIMLSLHNDHIMISRLMELGAHAYLQKTADPEIIYETILACCEQDVNKHLV